MSGFDLTCPYCNSQNDEIDDCYDQETLYEIQCKDCKKYFGYEFTYLKVFKERILPCANGEEHSWKEIVGYPKELYKDKYRCEHCEEEKVIKEKGK